MQKKNIPLMIGVLVPIILIILVALSIYLPGLFTKPQYDFVYSNGTGDPYYCETYQYYVSNNQIQKRTIPKKDIPTENDVYCKVVEPVELFLHHIETNKSEAITLEKAQTLSLNPSLESPDGFEVVPGSGGGFLFGSFGGYDTKYLKGHGSSKKLNLSLTTRNYYNFTFLGWVNK